MKRKTITLKQRIVIMFLVCMLIVFSTILIISNYAMNSLLSNKLDTSYQSNVRQTYLMLDNVISNMGHVSQQLANSDIVSDLERYLTADQSYEKIQYADQVKSTVNLLTFTNPNIGLAMYVDAADQQVIFANGSVAGTFDVEGLPVLSEYNYLQYLGPYPSMTTSNNRIVVGALRKVELSDSREVYLYMESAFRIVEDILANSQENGEYPILFLDNQRKVVYSQQEDQFPVGYQFDSNSNRGKQGEFYWYQEVSNQGWGIVLLVPQKLYLQERNQWLAQVLLLCFGVVILCLFMSLTLWKKIYRPLQSFDREIETILIQGQPAETLRTDIPEYDHLLDKFSDMKQQIQKMILQISEQEKNRADLEIEKLRYQINPHFLMNTLNTVHWMAIMNNQNDIDKIVQALNRLLLYNLNKESYETTVMQEVNALKEYLLLQQVRYDFTFESNTIPEGETLEYRCPKFILQPLVENALYHGYRYQMNIRVDVRVGSQIEIDIVDDGLGMDEEQCSKLLQPRETDQKSAGMGIGLNYVVQALDHYYRGQARIAVESRQDEGTTVHLILPKTMEEA